MKLRNALSTQHRAGPRILRDQGRNRLRKDPCPVTYRQGRVLQADFLVLYRQCMRKCFELVLDYAHLRFSVFRKATQISIN